MRWLQNTDRSTSTLQSMGNCKARNAPSNNHSIQYFTLHIPPDKMV
jgi:hypothetical protein